MLNESNSLKIIGIRLHFRGIAHKKHNPVHCNKILNARYFL